MTEDKIAKNLLLNKTCDNCLSKDTCLTHENNTCDHYYDKKDVIRLLTKELQIMKK
jgi:hypothetical protein